MAELKTRQTQASVADFINSVENKTRREDARTLLSLFKKNTGEKAVMWGPSIIGFGKYHYKSDRSSQEGDWMRVGFSPQKASLSLYLMSDFKEKKELLKQLGKHKTGVGCLYINKLADIDIEILEQLIKKSYKQSKQDYKAA